jgi:hypothetical protein
LDRGTGRGNNRQWFEFLRQAGASVPGAITTVSEFFEREVLPFAIRNFATTHYTSVDNTVEFRSAQEIDLYWRSNIYFDPGAEDRVHAAATRVCRERGALANRKRVSLVHMSERIDA